MYWFILVKTNKEAFLKMSMKIAEIRAPFPISWDVLMRASFIKSIKYKFTMKREKDKYTGNGDDQLKERNANLL